MKYMKRREKGKRKIKEAFLPFEQQAFYHPLLLRPDVNDEMREAHHGQATEGEGTTL